MRLQDSQANCGPSAARNALKALGMDRSIPELETLFKTDATNGTSAANVVKGLKKLDDLQPQVIEESRPEVAHLLLAHVLHRGRPVLLCVDGWGHFVAAIGLLGGRVLVADSADSELVLSYTMEEVMERWCCQGQRKAFWAVAL